MLFDAIFVQTMPSQIYKAKAHKYTADWDFDCPDICTDTNSYRLQGYTTYGN